ncbi:hypothetical protein B2J93_3830 [Marssonina coronariae]|uniref:Uncharacterized protein n=1 Tax=Diplocarpon coronariae TaxID=2795749 RepID=A0A218ZGE1_9HELO|nr:hypothetical protein B2J93_3830 [Marssonina coronariae]
MAAQDSFGIGAYVSVQANLSRDMGVEADIMNTVKTAIELLGGFLGHCEDHFNDETAFSKLIWALARMT